VVITHVVQPGVPDRSALLNAVELSAVIGQQQVVSALGCVRQEEAILLALPAELSRVVDSVSRQHAPQRLHQLDRYVFVE